MWKVHHFQILSPIESVCIMKEYTQSHLTLMAFLQYQAGSSLPVRKVRPLSFTFVCLYTSMVGFGVVAWVCFVFFSFLLLSCYLCQSLTLFPSTGLELAMSDQAGPEPIEIFLLLLLECREQRHDNHT